MTQIRVPVFAANWKMFKGPEETAAFIEVFAESHAPRSDAAVVLFPPSISLAAFGAATADRPDLEFGIQDVHAEADGAHTGAISASMVPQTGATWGLAGHSERRREFGDTDAEIASKLQRLIDAGLQPVLCVGETLEEREAGQLVDVLATQIRGALAPLASEDRLGLLYAYEPVWAIGTGRTASPADAAGAHAVVRAEVAEAGGAEPAHAIILYGGSVKPGNIDELLDAPGVDGVLVGGASLDPESWAAICSSGR